MSETRRPGLQQNESLGTDGSLNTFWFFLMRFLKNPRTVGAVAPSSRFLSLKMLDPVEWSPGVTVVEFGPGTGPFTREILKRLPPDGRYLGIERDPLFVEILRSRFPERDFVCDSVERLVEISSERDIAAVDHIVSGLPFASLPPNLAKSILDKAELSLRPGGAFTTFQYLHALYLPAARLFRKEMAQRFGPPVSRIVEFRNLPPAFVFTWRKPRA